MMNVDGEMQSLLESEEIAKLSPHSKINALRKISEDMEPGEHLKALQTYIVQLMSEQLSGPLEFATEVPRPEKYDVLITDIKPRDLIIIGDELGYTPLTVATTEPVFPVQGILYGPSMRMFVPLIVQKRSKCIYVNFLLDTGSPNTYLREETFHALGFLESIADSTNVAIHGTAMTVWVSTHHFQNVDILGQDYLANIRALLTVDYPLKAINIAPK
jgi:hypothetical protein